MAHAPVLRDEAAAALATDAAGIYVDATFGRGGHARALLAALDPEATLIAVDRDADAVAAAEALAAADGRVRVLRGAFGALDRLVRSLDVERVHGVLMDLGVSSPQLDDAARGFSFRHDGPLDMRMDDRQSLTAAEFVNTASEAELADVFRRYGEERHARRVARAVVSRRARTPLTSTAELAEVVIDAQPRPDRHKHGATRVFQAIRMHVNDEPGELTRGLAAAFELLAAGGRLAVISFQSLEDRQVKRTFKRWVEGERLPRRLPQTGAVHGAARYVARRVRPDAAEVAANPRSRSAVLRVVERLA